MIFIVVFTILFYAFDAYIISKWMNYVKAMGYPKYFYKSAWIVSVLMLMSLALYAYLRYKDPLIASEIGILHTIVTVWYIPKLLLLPFFILIDIFKIIKKGLVALNQPQQHSKIKEQKNLDTTDKYRRKFTRNLGLTVSSVPFIIVSKGAFDSVTSPKVHKVDIPLNNLPKAFDGTTIAQISDVHVGSFRSDKMFKEIVQTVNDMKPDIFVNTGDYVNFNPEELELFHDLWKGFKPDIGTYSCLGNHDHYMTDQEHDILLDSLNDLEQNLLMNEHQIIERKGKQLVFAGIDNYGFGQKYGDFDKALKGIDEDKPVIFLCHDPTNWDLEVRKKRHADLMLSGHTHGGQFGIKFMGKEYSPVALRYNQWAGLYKDKEQYLYVNRGLGTSGFPVRVGMNPEITLITLHSTQQGIS
jgi:predicted MPP superfamily phosphohydrolase